MGAERIDYIVYCFMHGCTSVTLYLINAEINEFDIRLLDRVYGIKTTKLNDVYYNFTLKSLSKFLYGSTIDRPVNFGTTIPQWKI